MGLFKSRVERIRVADWKTRRASVVRPHVWNVGYGGYGGGPPILGLYVLEDGGVLRGSIDETPSAHRWKSEDADAEIALMGALSRRPTRLSLRAGFANAGRADPCGRRHHCRTGPRNGVGRVGDPPR